MIYGSVFSGIEAASMAWEPLGWRPAWFSEIEPFPSAVLAERWPDVANLGDMTTLAARIAAGEIIAPDLLVGGSPCQAFSIAGARNGLNDARGQLTLAYVELADAIDDKRKESGEKPAIVVWENVGGVHTDKSNAFGCFISGLAGGTEPAEPGPRPEHGKSNKFWRWSTAGEHVPKWTKSGCVIGPKRRLAWRILDAQYFNLAQRRARVLVVASARDDIDPAKILLEFDGVRRDSAPCRGEGAAVTALTANGVGVRGADDNQAQAGHLLPVAGTIAAHSFTGGAGGKPEGAATGHLVPVAFGGGNCSGPLDVAACLTAKGQRNDFDVETFCIQHAQIGRADNAGPQGKGYQPDIAYTLDSRTEADAVCFAQNSRGEIRLEGGDGNITGTISAGGGKPGQGYQAVSVTLRGRDGGSTAELGGDIAGTLRAAGGGGDKPHVLDCYQVRRLTPVECERLQGFPDNHTRIVWRGKDAADCPDGLRYRAIGNSMPVTLMRWLGERIAASVEAVKDENPYCAALDALRVKPFHELKEVGDQWRTPDEEYWGINARFGPFSLDLFADHDNAKCAAYYTAADNALTPHSG